MLFFFQRDDHARCLCSRFNVQLTWFVEDAAVSSTLGKSRDVKLLNFIQSAIFNMAFILACFCIVLYEAQVSGGYRVSARKCLLIPVYLEGSQHTSWASK